jgi:hypothetical protein
MTAAVHDFKAIARKLNRQEQKAEFEAKNPEPAAWSYGVATNGFVTDAGLEKLTLLLRKGKI